MKRLKENYKSNNYRKNILIFSVFLFVFFVALTACFPYSGDDWAWGSSIGIDRLNSWFKNYNGRYGGNLLVLLLTRSNILKVLFMSVSFYLVCLFTHLYGSIKKISTFVLSAFLFLAIPKRIFAQALVWTSGYTNYVPPILITVLFFLIIKNIFKDEAPKYSKIMPVITIIMGFVAALFMENVTLYNIFISVAVIVFVSVKFKKFYWTHLGFFFGSIVGAGFMFTNSAYGIVASNKDDYRSTALSSGDFIQTVIEHFEKISNYVVIGNVILCAVMTVLVAALAIKFLKTNPSKKASIATCIMLFFNVLSLILAYMKQAFEHWIVVLNNNEASKISNVFFFGIVLVYGLTLIVIPFICINDKNEKFRIELPILSVPVIVAPLLVVNPIGPRCFFPSYFLMMIFAVSLYGYLIKDSKKSNITDKISTVSFGAGVVAFMIFFLSIFSAIHSYSTQRDEFVKEQINNGETNVIVCELPYSSYVWDGDPDSEPWTTRYKLFHKYDKNIKFEFVKYKDFDKFRENYLLKEKNQ